MTSKLKEYIRFLLLIDRNTAVYFDSFGTEYILHKALNKIKDKPIIHSIFRIKDDDYVNVDFILSLS